MYQFQCNRCFIISEIISENSNDAPTCCGREPMTPIYICPLSEAGEEGEF
jgi:hypothetical protein